MRCRAGYHKAYGMRPLRALLGFALIGWTSVWLTSAPATAPRTVRPVSAVTVPATTSTVAITTTTSTTVAAPRASRAAIRPRPTTAELDDGTRQRVIAAICSHNWDCGLMVRVGGCESGLRPWARRGSHVGIFQIAGATPGLIEEHVDLAYSMWRSHGMRPWAASRSCWD